MTAAGDRALVEAARRLERGDLPGALDALLHGWRLARDATLATRIAQLGDALGQALPPIEGDNPSDRHARWLACAAEARPVDQWRLSRAFARPPMTRITARLRWLAGQPADPRWTPLVVEIAVAHALDYWPELAPSPRRIWRRCLDVLADLGDPAGAGWLDATIARLQIPADPRGAGDACRGRLSALRRTLRAIPAGPPPGAEALATFDAAFAAWRAGPAPRPEDVRPPTPVDRGADLRALIQAEPDDVDLRRVFADWLEATGAPRAELMRLQLQEQAAARPSAARAKRIARLIHRYEVRWLGALAPFVREVEWHLGFPRAATVLFRGQKQRDAALADPAWRTFTEIHTRDPQALSHPNLAGVQQIGRSSPLVSCQSRLSPVAVEVVEAITRPVGCRRLIVEGEPLSRLDRALWPALERVEIDAFGEGALAGAPIEWLDALGLDTLVFWRVAADAIGPIARRCAQTPRLAFDDGWAYRSLLDRRGPRPHLDIVWRHTRACDAPERVGAAAHALGAATVRVLSPGYTQPRAVLDAWRAALAPLTPQLPRARRARPAG